eukprot:6929489-Lingulodinium_polyedra.AAC.1
MEEEFEFEGPEGPCDVDMGAAPGPEDAMLGALFASMPVQLRREAEGLLDLFAIHGCSAADSKRKVAELYSPPRVTVELGKMRRVCPGLSLREGSTFDLYEDEHGERYDFLTARDRQRARERLREERPWLVVGSPPCTDYCQFNEGLNFKRMPEAE